MSLNLLTEEKITEAADHVRQGNSKVEVSVIFGVTENTLWSLLRRAELILEEREPETPEEELLIKLHMELDSASVEADNADLAIIEEPHEEDWRAAAFLLKYSNNPLDEGNPYADIPDIPSNTDWGKAAIRLLRRFEEDQQFDSKCSNAHP